MQRLLFLSVLAAGCAHPAYSRPPEVARAGRPVEAGDVLAYRVEGDDSMTRTLTARPDATVPLPGCDAPVPIAGRTTDALETAAARCLVGGHLYLRPPTVRLTMLTAARSIHLELGSPPVERVLATDRAPTLTNALVVAVATEQSIDDVTLVRAGRSYRLDVEAIERGGEPDVTLLPGDTLVVPEARRLLPEKAAQRPPLPEPTSYDVARASCGELALRHARLDSLGAGPAHPEQRAVQGEVQKRCDGPDAVDSFRAACIDAYRRRAELTAAGKMDKHPDVRAVDAELRACPPEDQLGEGTTEAPTAEQCSALRRQREGLIASGKGVRHPEVVALDVRLESCADTP